MGGLGGFFPPIVLAVIFNMTGHYAIGFMSLAMFALASFVIVVWMYYLEKLSLETKLLDHVGQSMMVTDAKGKIEKVNHAFTDVTGYLSNEVMGGSPKILQSGRHDRDYYKKMWDSLQEKDYWQGEIWNKRKNGEIYLEWLTISAVKNDAGEIKNYLALFSDLTGKKS
jgi:NNP family nitrate/nitrite transporter-like MFS transporter